MIIAIDFDGTIVEHKYPDIGKPVPKAFYWMKKWQGAGARLILWTMRADGQRDGDVLTDAVEFCGMHGITFFGINKNPEQHTWTASPKAYAKIYLDDAAYGVPLVKDPNGGKSYVNWEIVGPDIMEKILALKSPLRT